MTTADLRNSLLWLSFFVAIGLVLVTDAIAQRPTLSTQDDPVTQSAERYCIGTHDVGRLVLGLTNFGRIGLGEGKKVTVDCFTGKRVMMGEYPKNSNRTYFYKGGIWVGAVIGKDTLVSTGADFNNQYREMHPIIPLVHRSTLDPNSEGFEAAVSEQDYIAVYSDAITQGVQNPSFDPIDRRPHHPLEIEIAQRSFAWSYAHVEDFIIVEYTLYNVGTNFLKDTYIGVYWDADVFVGDRNVNVSPDPYGRKVNPGGLDDHCGFIFSVPEGEEDCDYIDTLSLAWTVDNDGKWGTGNPQLPDIIAVGLLRPIQPDVRIGFNWWRYNYNPAYDFGPQMKENYRFMGNGCGTPYGDRNKYAMLSNGEIDYDSPLTASIGPVDRMWSYPGDHISRYVSWGSDVQLVLSMGPFDLAPGDVVEFPVMIVVGEGFHVDRLNPVRHLWWSYAPYTYYALSDFSDLIHNAQTAKHVYDVPGVDSDSNGWAGEFIVCEDEDTVYYRGDGTPDYVAAAPPPAPKVWVEPTLGGLRVRFNGYRSETTKDIFSRIIDFEGYNVYVARDNRQESYSLVASYDRENYDKFVLTYERDEIPRYLVYDNPFTIDELRCLYGNGPDACTDSSFDPLDYDAIKPYVHPEFEDSVFYFVRHGYNRSVLGATSPITKVFPDEPYPESKDLDSTALTDEGYPKYYEYEFVMDDLLSSVPYFISVTAFDFGSPEAGREGLETAVTLAPLVMQPDNQWDESPNEVGNVYVYPNPYRQDGWYRIAGWEGRMQEDRSRDRVRRINFANLPAKCTISIFSLDGDLIRKLYHDAEPSDPNSAYDQWDLVTRNMQLVVSGMYYWIVEDEQGQTQIGKLVILL